MTLDYKTKVILGLDNVDNTSDLNKPVSTAQQSAINNAVSGKIDSNGDIGSTHIGNTDTTITRDANGNMIFQDKNTPAVMLQEIDCPKLIWISGATLSNNVQTALTDATNWNTNKAKIDHIIISTTSSNWTLLLYSDDSGTSGVFNSITLMTNASGTKIIPLYGLPYVDNNSEKSIKLKFTDNAGSAVATATILGVKAR